MLHSRHHEQHRPSPAETVLGSCGVRTRRRHKNIQNPSLDSINLVEPRVTKVVILAPANNGMDFESIFVAHIASDRGVYRVVVFRWTQSINKQVFRNDSGHSKDWLC
jgi:hypothetical protein